MRGYNGGVDCVSAVLPWWKERVCFVSVSGRQKWIAVMFAAALTIGVSGAFLWAGSQPVPQPATRNEPEHGNGQDAPLLRPFVMHHFETEKTESSKTQPRFLVADRVKQGEVLKVALKNITGVQWGTPDFAYVTLAGRKARLFTQKNGDLLALMPVSIYEKPGVYPLTIYNAGDVPLKKFDVAIENGRYKTQNVSVSKGTAGLQPLPGELEAIQALKEKVSLVQYWEEPFMTPTSDCQNSPYGVKRYHNGVSTGDYHKGVDLRSPAGRPIKAIAAGKVEISTMYRLHGGTVGLDHGQGIGSVYIHMSKLGVKKGDIVKKGQVIGYVGSTGFASGPHLHWGMYVSGLPVNPNQWIAGVPLCR
jgi:murein DD-endopeptidase MepM/ murein hydrolase activator NlpD